MKIKRKISATDCKRFMGHQTGMFIASNDRNNFAPCNFQEKHTEQSYHKSHHKRKLWTNVNLTLFRKINIMKSMHRYDIKILG